MILADFFIQFEIYKFTGLSVYFRHQDGNIGKNAWPSITEETFFHDLLSKRLTEVLPTLSERSNETRNTSLISQS